tara:strand:+ start:221 stop:1441 length:1221 start_codon:yes stop_codon:yes gene_type:complete
MKTIFFTGHNTFNNRGCEAIIKSSIELIRKQNKSFKFIVPSKNIKQDINKWPEAEKMGVSFIKYQIPFFLRIFWKIQKTFKLSRFHSFNYYPKSILNIYKNVDVFLSVGGDNYSLDYSFPNYIIYQDRIAYYLKKPVILWGASVGKFEKMPSIVSRIKEHLSKMKVIYAREEITYNYLKSELGLKNVKMSCDPAFSLIAEKNIEVDSLINKSKNKNFIGINLSKLIIKFTHKRINICEEIKQLVSDINNFYKMKVVLIPHVWNSDKYESSDDYQFLYSIYRQCKAINLDISIAPKNLNASQIKYLISFSRIFIGSRTHSTIAALSMNIPTITISYSVKSKGINKMIFDNKDLVINCDQFNKINLIKKIKEVLKNEENYRDLLARKNNSIKKVLSNSSLDLYNQIIQ